MKSQAERLPADWREGLPDLRGERVTLRELRTSDAASLYGELTTPEVKRFIWTPPPNVAAFERFIEWTLRERAAGRYVCFAVVPNGIDEAVGLFQVQALDARFDIAEWGFALGCPFWGSGMFVQASRQILDFAFDVLGVRRLEARASVHNGRGNGALQKIGAIREAVLRKSFLHNGQYHDQVLWSIHADEWRLRQPLDREVVSEERVLLPGCDRT